jgi:hypothetical protein
MASVKYNGVWYEYDSLTVSDKERLGIIDEKKIKKELSETPEEFKKKPCKKKKGAGK